MITSEPVHDLSHFVPSDNKNKAKILHTQIVPTCHSRQEISNVLVVYK
jgi:hypothetical protein